MKKLFLLISIMLCAYTVNAQTAIEESKTFDNMSLGVTVGALTPLDFNSTFPLNFNTGVRIGKDFTPVVGLQLEGLAIFNDNHFADLKTAVKAMNIGLNGTINLTNWFCGYNGSPRLFEVKTVTGLGWLHAFDAEVNKNDLTAKTGLDLAFNLGAAKAHSIVITPAVYWNLSKDGGIKFNKTHAQLALNVSYIYYFRNSNGTHSFKTYDIGEMNHKIVMLQRELRKERNKKPQVIERVTKEVIAVPSQYVIQFAQGSAELTPDAKAVLDGIRSDITVNVVGMASPEGSNKRNMQLSELRAKNVADYLQSRGVKVNMVKGEGTILGKSTNRLSLIDVVPSK